MRLVATQQIPFISMEMALIISESKAGLLIPVTSIYLIMQFRTSWKKIVYKNLKRYENIEGPSAAMSYVWD